MISGEAHAPRGLATLRVLARCSDQYVSADATQNPYSPRGSRLRQSPAGSLQSKGAGGGHFFNEVITCAT